VVVEAFTATWCHYCTLESQAMHMIEGNYSRNQVAVAEWHPNDGYDPPDKSNNKREADLKVNGYPTVFFDDWDSQVGAGGGVQNMYNIYKSKIDAHLAKAGEVTVFQTSKFSGSYVDVTATVNPELKSGKFNVRILLVEHIGVVESNHSIDWVVRATITNESVDLTQGKNTDVSGSVGVDGSWKTDELYTLAFVEDTAKKDIFNGNISKIGATGSGDKQAPTVSAVQHSPANPTDKDQVTVSAMVTDDVGVQYAWVYYDDGSGSKKTVMTGSGSTYAAKIGPFAGDKNVTYHIEANDAAGNVGKSQNSTFSVASTADKKAPVISSVSNSPASPTDKDSVKITATITDDVGVTSADVKYDDGSGVKSAAMSSGGSSYSANIGRFAAGATVTYHVEAKDAAGNLAKSSDGTFNVQQATAQPPDVTVSDVQISPSSPKVGETVTITATVENVGTGVASNVNVAFSIDGSSLGTKSITTLAAGASTKVQLTWNAQDAGSKSLKAEATANGDTNNANDVKTMGFTVSSAGAGGGGGGTGGSGSSGTSGVSILLTWFVPIIVVVVLVIALAYALERRKRRQAQYHWDESYRW
jgi:hypothetical protein